MILNNPWHHSDHSFTPRFADSKGALSALQQSTYIDKPSQCFSPRYSGLVEKYKPIGGSRIRMSRLYTCRCQWRYLRQPFFMFPWKSRYTPSRKLKISFFFFINQVHFYKWKATTDIQYSFWIQAPRTEDCIAMGISFSSSGTWHLNADSVNAVPVLFTPGCAETSRE